MMDARARLILGRCLQIAIEDWVWSQPPRKVVDLRERLLEVVENLRWDICTRGTLPIPPSARLWR